MMVIPPPRLPSYGRGTRRVRVGIAMNCRTVLNDLETRPRTVDQSRCRRCPCCVRATTRGHTCRHRRAPGADLPHGSRDGHPNRHSAPPELSPASSAKIAGEPPIGRRNDHSRARPIFRNTPDEHATHARSRYIEQDCLDEATVEHIECAGSLFTDSDTVVCPHRGEGSSPSRSRSRRHASPHHSR